MSGRSTLTEYMILCLNAICGRFLREGDAVANPGVLLPACATACAADAAQACTVPGTTLVCARPYRGGIRHAHGSTRG